MMNIVAGLLIAVLGMIFLLWPNATWYFRWGWRWDRDPTRAELMVERLGGIIIVVAGIALAIHEMI